MNSFVSIFLSVCLLAGMATGFAAENKEARAVLGADLTDSQKAEVYRSFGIKEGSVPELTITNDEEKEYLNGIVDSKKIGNNSLSCVYIEILPEGEGLKVATSNISWCSETMYKSALATVGIDNAKLIVASPVKGSSGTAALAGIYKAYEDMTGKKLSRTRELAGTLELATTASLAKTVGNSKAVKIVTELKTMLPQTKNMSDDELKTQLKSIASGNKVTLSDSQTEKLVTLCRTLEKLDPQELKAKAEALQKTLTKLAAARAAISSALTAIGAFLKSAGAGLKDIFEKLGL